MLSGIIKILVAFILVAATIAGFSSKKPPEKKVKGNYYYYFPQANVYFDSVSKSYSYQNQKNEGWHTDVNIPDSIRFLMNKKVLLGKRPEPVWKENEHDRLVYAISLYAKPEDFKEKKVEPPLPAPIAVKDSAEAREEPAQHESKIKRFFRKLFHKAD
jgi:hypothetical protein